MAFAHRDVVIEAVFEDLALKQRMVGEIEQCCGPQTIFASNTSSLPIGEIAAQAARPEKVIGLHFFSARSKKMPLVEVIPHATTDEQNHRHGGEAGEAAGQKRRSWLPTVPVFMLTVFWRPYINEAMRLLLEGEPVEHIDNALVKFGFPVGPIQLLDEVGIDTGTKIIPVLETAFGERFSPPAKHH